jgi:hypothetical protein
MDAPKSIHYTQLPPMEPGSEIAQEWDTYRREVGRLLAEGHEGQWVLIKGNQIIELFDTDEAAGAAGSRRFLLQPYFIQQIRAEEPLHHHLRYLWYRPCPT